MRKIRQKVEFELRWSQTEWEVKKKVLKTLILAFYLPRYNCILYTVYYTLFLISMSLYKVIFAMPLRRWLYLRKNLSNELPERHCFLSQMMSGSPLSIFR